ncbi:WGR domain-containing protein [Rubellimicrobium roseum]|uniref:WGR domain-containing protein n=1 Tax=Rubellimicrobium roseum TaxID=687525 RepID=UPI001FE939FA|nr:WGR domain-containing protein [Rubellimicrobium roseum]
MERTMNDTEQPDLLHRWAAQPPDQHRVTPDRVPSSDASDLRPARLTRVDPAFDLRRFHSLALANSLFGEYGVVRHWGRIGTAGQSRTT